MRLLYGICLLSFVFFWSHLEAEEKSIPALMTESAIKVDGKLEEEVWQKARLSSDFIQYEPNMGLSASFNTTVRVLYDKHTVYFGIHCFDPQPQRIVSKVSKREGFLQSDDSLSIALDTFQDGQSAYIFFTNPKGIQKDGRLADNGRTFDDTRDGEWLDGRDCHSSGYPQVQAR